MSCPRRTPALDVPPPEHVPRSGVLLSSDACQSHLQSLQSIQTWTLVSGAVVPHWSHDPVILPPWSYVNVAPVERYTPVVDFPSTAPPQTMH